VEGLPKPHSLLVRNSFFHWFVLELQHIGGEGSALQNRKRCLLKCINLLVRFFMLKNILFSSLLISTFLARDGVYAMGDQDNARFSHIICSESRYITDEKDKSTFKFKLEENVKKEVITLLLDQPFLDSFSLQPQDLFERGLGYLKDNTPESTRRGIQYWAIAGLSPAAGYYFLADMCAHGGIQDPEEEIRYLQIAADLRSAMASFTLGWYYFTGTKVPPNIEKALDYFKEAGKLETFYFIPQDDRVTVRDGCSFKRIKEKSFEVTKKSLQETILSYDFAEKMVLGPAYYNLGLMYGRCQEIKNMEKAEEYIKKAAYLGCSEAIKLLEDVYRKFDTHIKTIKGRAITSKK
jgi:hypothetical protein